MSCDGNPLVDVRTGARHADVQLGGLWNRHCLKEDANRRMRRWFEREGRGVSPRVPGVLNFFRAQTGIWRLLSFVSVRTIKGRSIGTQSEKTRTPPEGLEDLPLWRVAGGGGLLHDGGRQLRTACPLLYRDSHTHTYCSVGRLPPTHPFDPCVVHIWKFNWVWFLYFYYSFPSWARPFSNGIFRSDGTSSSRRRTTCCTSC